MFNFKFLILVFILTISLISCKEETYRYNKIERKKFIKILIDIHKNDALIKLEELSDKNLKKVDSLSYYNQIFKEHGITRAQFYNTFEYYIKNMDDFLEMQKIIVDSLNARYNYIDSINRLNLEKNDLWKLKRTWTLPDDGITNSIPFKHISNKSGNYTISAEIKSFEDDLSKSLKIRIEAHYEDTTENFRQKDIYTKNGEWEKYNVTISTNPNKKLKFIKGELLSHSNKTTYMHVKVKNIMLTFEKTEDTEKKNPDKEGEK